MTVDRSGSEPRRRSAWLIVAILVAPLISGWLLLGPVHSRSGRQGALLLAFLSLATAIAAGFS